MKTYWAELDESDTVLRILVIDVKNPSKWLADNVGGKWVQSFEDGSLRFNAASVGGRYDSIDDAFIAPIPNCEHETLLLDENKKWQCQMCDDEISERFNGV